MMNTAKDIVVYGASGYTGKLIAESLHKRGIPFTAAGRNAERLKAALEIVSERVGGETVNAEIAVVSHEEDALASLFSDAKVVANVTGPFAEIGETVVKAALAADCHYIDTTGEQDFMLDMKSKYGKAFEVKGLVLSPACSFMWLAGALAAEVCLEEPGVDSLEILYVNDGSLVSVASGQSFTRMLCVPHYYLQNNQLIEWELGRAHDVIIPGRADVFRGSPWGGAGEPLWYSDDPAVQSCKVLNCSPDNDTMQMVMDAVKGVVAEADGDVSKIEAITKGLAATIVAEEPEKESPLISRGVVHCTARGPLEERTCALRYQTSYILTGEVIAEAALLLLQGKQKETGFVSPAKAFDHRHMLNMLEEAGLAKAITS